MNFSLLIQIKCEPCCLIFPISYGTFQGEIHHVINPDPYRGVFGSDASCYARDLNDHIDYGTSGKVAGFISETIQVHVNYSLLKCQ